MSQNTAIYVQVMNSIKEKIVTGELKLGEKLPSERSMSIQYGINRMTVRNALKRLENEGCIKSIRGSGTYVAKVPKLEKMIELGENEIMSLSQQIRQKGLKSSRLVLSLKKFVNHDAIKDYFPDSEFIYEIVRLSLIDDEPYAVQHTYIPCNIFKEAERFDFADGSLYDYMSDFQHRPTGVISYLKVDKIPTQYAEILKLKNSKNIFIFDYFGFDESHKMVEYTISYHHPEYTSFKYITNH